MARIKINLPENFNFSCTLPVRITDLNYGGHVGNDAVLGILHEIRMQFFRHFGYSEMNFAGAGLLMADVAIEFKSELFYGDIITATVTAGEFSTIGFDVFYKLEKQVDEKQKLVVVAKTGMICFDYKKKKIIPVPDEALQKLIK